MLAEKQHQALVVNIQEARYRRSPMQGAQAEAAHPAGEGKDMEVTREEEQVSHWVTKGFLGLVSIGVMLLISFGGWIIVSLNQINQSTNTLSTEFSAYKSDMNDLKLSVDSLRIRAEGWATKDQMISSKEVLLERITAMQGELNDLKLRLTRLETTPPR